MMLLRFGAAQSVVREINMELFLISSVLMLSGHLVTSDADHQSWNKFDALRKKLLQDYDKMVLPQRNVNGTTDVHIDIMPSAIWIEDDTQIMNVDAWLIMMWTDERLKWDPKDYGSVSKVFFGDSELWKPDITVFNNADATDIDHYGSTHFTVSSDGVVVWSPPVTFRVVCPVDLTYWPYDQQTCFVYFASWTTSGWDVNLWTLGNSTQMHLNTVQHDANLWHLVSGNQTRTVLKYDCCPEKYVFIDYYFTLQRFSPTFTATLVVPTVALSCFLMLQFVLPVGHENRITLGCIAVLAAIIELIYLKMSIPYLGISVPLVVVFYSEMLFLSVLSVCVSVILTRLAHPENPIFSAPPPLVIKRVLTGPVATVLLLRQHASKVGLSGKDLEDGETLEAETANFNHEWLFVAKCLDRIISLLFLAILLISMLVYISSVKQSSSN